MSTKTNPLASVRVKIPTPTGTAIVVLQIALEAEQPDGPPQLCAPTLDQALAALTIAGRHAQQLRQP